MTSFTNGKVLKDEDFLVELEKLDKLNRQKAVVKLDKTTNINEIFNVLAKVDEVKIKLDEETELRICHNNKYFINNHLFGFNSTDKYGTEYDEETAKKTVPFTGEQKLKQLIKFILENL
jgi:hypothetical protein